MSHRLPPLHLKLIPYAPYGEDVFGVGWVFFYGSAYAVDVYGDGGGVAQGFHAPYAVVQGVTAEYDACGDHEKMKQRKFLIGQFHGFSSHGDGVGGFIQYDASQGEGTGMFLFPAAFELFIPGKLGFDLGSENGRREWLFYVFIGTESQGADFVDILMPCTDDGDGDVLFFPQLPSDFESVHAWKH